MNLRYQGPEDIDRDEFLAVLRSEAAPVEIAQAMVSAAFRIDDWRWLEDRFVELLSHDDPGLRGTAAMCLGHVARIHGHLHIARVRPLVEELLQVQSTSGKAEDALEDIDAFAKEPPADRE
jgi:hypothetical protein